MEKSPTADLVRQEIKKNLFVEELLKENLINHSSLARKMLPEIKKINPKATFDSVLIAIKRQVMVLPKTKLVPELKDIIGSSELLMKNEILEITVERNPALFLFLNDLAKSIRWDLGEVFFVVQGSGEITLIIDAKNQEKFSKIKSQIIETRKKLAFISVRESSKKYSKEVKGYLSFLTNKLTENDINIVEIASTHKQVIFIIEEKDLIKAYGVFNELIKAFRQSD